MQISEPATDLAVATAIVSSYFERPVPVDTAVVGEIGLAGELRQACALLSSSGQSTALFVINMSAFHAAFCFLPTHAVHVQAIGPFAHILHSRARQCFA